MNHLLSVEYPGHSSLGSIGVNYVNHIMFTVLINVDTRVEPLLQCHLTQRDQDLLFCMVLGCFMDWTYVNQLQRLTPIIHPVHFTPSCWRSKFQNAFREGGESISTTMERRENHLLMLIGRVIIVHILKYWMKYFLAYFLNILFCPHILN